MATRSEAVRADEEIEPRAEVDTTAETVDDDDKEEKGRRSGRAPLEGVAPIRDLRNEEGQSIADWVRGVGPDQGPVLITVSRREPKRHRGVKCDGLLMKFDALVDDIEDRVREEQGGGTFLVGVKVPRDKGAGWRILTSRQIEIPGDPKVDHLREQDPNASAAAAAIAAVAPAADTKLADRVLTRAFDMIDRNDKPTTPMGPVSDPNMGRMIDGLNATIRALQSQLEARDAQITALMNRADKTDPFKDTLLSKMFDGESARILAIRTQHDSELGAMRTAMVENEKRLRDQFERDMKRLEDAHAREIQTLRDAFGQSGTAKDVAATTQKLVLDGQIAQLTREIDRLAKENIELRAKKDKSPLEIAKELKSLKEALSDDDDKEPEKENAIVQGIKVLADSKIAAGMLKKFGMDEDEKKPPVGRPYRLADGRVVMTDAAGVTVPVPTRRRRGPPGAAPGTPAATGTESAPPAPPQVSPVAVEAAVQFLENAFRNNHDAAAVAESVRTMIPADVMAAIRDRGVDDFLDQVAKLPGGSPLASQKGRLFARKVGKALIDGSPQ